jgi:hypothetical protein
VNDIAQCVPYEPSHPLIIQGVIYDITNRKWLEDDRQKLLYKLQESLTQIKTLSGLLPICSSCKKIRDDNGNWQNLEKYVREHTEATFTHSVCPECFSKLYPDLDPIEPKGSK